MHAWERGGKAAFEPARASGPPALPSPSHLPSLTHQQDPPRSRHVTLVHIDHQRTLRGRTEELRRWTLTIRSHLVPRPQQFAFSKGAGCGDALLAVQQAVAGFCGGTGATSVGLLGLDCSKAFDVLPHSTILQALHHHGVPPHLTNTIRDWLRGRTAAVLSS
mgnify:CR=1 FL=1